MTDTEAGARPTQREARQLRAKAQTLKIVLKLGKQGVTPSFLASLDEALTRHELVKVRFEEFKDARHELAPQLAGKTASHLITVVGHVAVLFRRNPALAAGRDHGPETAGD